jgi:formate-dependent nitrite reductase membrane component NrfD
MAFLIKLVHCTASLFAFGALILQLFILLANIYNVPFLKDMYFARLTKNETFIDFGLW